VVWRTRLTADQFCGAIVKLNLDTTFSTAIATFSGIKKLSRVIFLRDVSQPTMPLVHQILAKHYAFAMQSDPRCRVQTDTYPIIMLLIWFYCSYHWSVDISRRRWSIIRICTKNHAAWSNKHVSICFFQKTKVTAWSWCETHKNKSGRNDKKLYSIPILKHDATV
jgi:hypothetical protein